MPKDGLILIVDDDPDFLEIFEAKLKSQGYKTALAHDGIEAVSQAKKLQPALILMDVQMPKKDGVQAVFELISDEVTRQIPIIFLTSLGDPTMSDLNRQFAKQMGARDYFKKGDNYEILMNRIRTVVAAA